MDNIIYLNFYNYCDYKSYRNLLLTCRDYYYDNNILNNDNIYKYYLENKFSKDFINISKLFIISYYDCFIQIINFEKKMNESELWHEQFYYLFWKHRKWI